MTPWPTADVASYNHSPPTYSYSPMQQQNYTDPFASYGAGPGMPQFNNNTQQQQQPPPPQQQPPAQQAPVANNNVDPWATMTMQAQPPAPTQPPMQAQPPMMQAQQPPSQPPMQQQMQQAIPQEQQTPPPAYVNATGNQTPPSPLGDVSVLAAANNAAVAAAQAISTAPSMPTAANTNMQPLQPVPQSMPMMMQAAPPQAQQQQQPTAAANPFDFNAVANTVPSVPVGAPPMAPPPAMAPPQAPPTPPDAVQQQQQTQQQPSFTTQSQYADPFGYAFSPMTSPVTSPGGSLNGTPNGSPGAIVPSSSPNADPFGVFGGQVPPAPPQNNTDPFGSSAGALVTSSTAHAPSSNGAVNDPFGIFGSGPAPAPTQAPPVVAQQQCQQQQAFSAPTTPQEEEDPWAAAGFGQAVSTSSPSQSNSFPQPSSSPVNNMNNNDSSPVYNHSNLGINGNKQEDKPITLDQNNLPSEGEYYEARINSRSLGTMFYTARNVEDTLFSKMASNVTAALGSRPIVAYVAENSAAHNAGIHLGHVILSVNGHEITDPEQCANVIRSAPRPMNIRCYVPPDLELTISEGKHMVKYDTKDLHAPSTKMEWKEKYVVIGGIVTKPWMVNMFYKKVSFDLL